MVQRAAVVMLTVIVALWIGAFITRVRSEDLGTVPSASPTTASATVTASRPSPSATTSTTSSPAIVMFCGAVTRYAADGAHMLLTLTVGTASQQFNLQYQFAQRPPPTDVGDRLARGETQLLRVTGRQSDPDSGSPGATSLRDYVVERVGACP